MLEKKIKEEEEEEKKERFEAYESLSTIISKSEFRFIIFSPWIYITKFAIYKIRVAPPTNEQGRRNKFDHFKVAVLLCTVYALSPGTFIRKFILLSTRGRGRGWGGGNMRRVRLFGNEIRFFPPPFCCFFFSSALEIFHRIKRAERKWLTDF